MRKHVIVYTEDEATGELGFRLKLMPALNNGEPECGGGALIAHDILEHLHGPREIGGIADELIALGAAWFVRGQWGKVCELRNNYRDEEHISGDVARFAPMWYEDQGMWFPAPVENLRAVSRAEAPLRRVYDYAYETWKKEVSYKAESVAQMADMMSATDEGYWPKVMPYLRYGFTKAARRYRNKNMSWLFWRLAHEVTKVGEHAEEGQEFVIHLDIANQTVSIDRE